MEVRCSLRQFGHRVVGSGLFPPSSISDPQSLFSMMCARAMFSLKTSATILHLLSLILSTVMSEFSASSHVDDTVGYRHDLLSFSIFPTGPWLLETPSFHCSYHRPR